MNVINIYLKIIFNQNKQLIYIKIFHEYIIREKLVYKILKRFYKLKKAKKLWNKTIIKFFYKISFILTNINMCRLITKRKKKFIIINIYVNNLIFGSKSLKALK